MSKDDCRAYGIEVQLKSGRWTTDSVRMQHGAALARCAWLRSIDNPRPVRVRKYTPKDDA